MAGRERRHVHVTRLGKTLGFLEAVPRQIPHEHIRPIGGRDHEEGKNSSSRGPIEIEREDEQRRKDEENWRADDGDEEGAIADGPKGSCEGPAHGGTHLTRAGVTRAGV